MKGLLLKDFYIAAKACRMQIVCIVLFTVLSLFIDTGMLYLLYSILFAGMIPTYILSVEEKCGWGRYAQALPCRREDVVREKYIAAVLSVGAVLALALLLWAVRVAVTGGSMAALWRMLALLCAVGLLFPTLTLPFMFRFGVEKGRLATVVVAALAAGGATSLGLVLEDTEREGFAAGLPADMERFAPLAVLAAVILFLLSWRLAVWLYKNRDL